MSLADVLGSHRVVVTVGSGGVGKTTTIAKLAARAARNDPKSVLVVTTDVRLAGAFSDAFERIWHELER